MKKLLRFSLMMLFALIGTNAMAQEVTLDFTVVDPSDETGKTSYWGFPSGSENKLTDEKSFTYGGYTVKVAAPDGYYWHNKDHYLLFGKMGATLTLPAFDFDVERIDIEGNGNASAGTKQNIFVGDEAVSTETTGAQGTNYFQIAEGKQAAGTVYVIKVTSKHNNQIKTIKIWKKGTSGDTPQPTDISNTAETAYTVAKAVELIEAGEGLSTEVYVKGIVTQVDSYNSTYNSITYWISDDGTTTSQQFEIYGGLNFEGGDPFTSKDDIAIGAKVIVKGKIKKFNTTYEMDKNNVLVEYTAPTNIQNLTIDTDVNAPLYNLKGERVDGSYHGVVIQNGQKKIQK